MSKIMNVVRFFTFLFFINLFNSLTHAASPETFDDPAKIAEQLTEMLAEGKTNELAVRAASLVGTPQESASFAKLFGIFLDRKAQFHDLVVDKTYGTSIRQIVFYLPYDDLTLLYVRFNFKRTKSGWIMARFDFKNETAKVFPEGLLD